MSRSATDHYEDKKRGIIVGVHELGKPAPRRDLCMTEYLLYDDSSGRRRKDQSLNNNVVEQTLAEAIQDLAEGHDKIEENQIT